MADGAVADPLILTATLDSLSTRIFQDLRDRHFPTHLNIVPAHLTLFHTLPGEHLRSIESDLAIRCAGEVSIPFRNSGLRFLGRGVAFDIDVPRLIALRKMLAAQWNSWLSRQDDQGFRPHVTVQNKVLPEDARALGDRLAATSPMTAGSIVGLDLWHYRSGPWERAAHFMFQA